MPFQSLIHANLVFIRWVGYAASDLDAVFALLRETAEQTGTPPHYIALVPEKVTLPEDVRGEFVRRSDEMMGLCQAIHLVFEGTGFLVSIKRSVVTGMLRAARTFSKTTSGRVFVYSSLQEVLQRVAPLDAQLQQDVTSRAAAL